MDQLFQVWEYLRKTQRTGWLVTQPDTPLHLVSPPAREEMGSKWKNLIRLGVDPAHAYQWTRTRKGGWAVALSRLVWRGYESMLKYYQSVNPSKQTPELNFG